MSCGPKRIQLLSVSDHGSHCTLLLQEEMMTDSLLISRIPRICQKSHHPWFAWIFDEKLLWAPPVSSNVSSPLYHQMYHHVSRPPSTNLNYAADHFAQTQTGGNFKIRNIWFSYKTFLLPSREDDFFFCDTKAWAELVGEQWKLEIGGSAQRSKGAHLGGADLWTELYSLAFFLLFLSLYMVVHPQFMQWSIFYFCQSKTRN